MPIDAGLLKRIKDNDTTLTTLDLSYQKLNAEDAKDLAKALETNASLTSISLNYNDIGDAGAKDLAKALETNASLTSINLKGNQIGAAGAKDLAKALATNASLTSISLNYNEIGAEGAKALARALETNASLTAIDLRHGNAIGDEGAKALAHALETNASLTAVNLQSNDIGAAGAKDLAKALETNASLTAIYLWGNNKIGDAGAKALAKALETNASLTVIDLTENAIGDAGAKALARALETNASLTEIHLWSNNIGTAGAKAIAHALATNASLTEMYLAGNTIGDVGTKAIARALETNASLTKINLDGIGEEAVNTLLQRNRARAQPYEAAKQAYDNAKTLIAKRAASTEISQAFALAQTRANDGIKNGYPPSRQLLQRIEAEEKAYQSPFGRSEKKEEKKEKEEKKTTLLQQPSAMQLPQSPSDNDKQIQEIFAQLKIQEAKIVEGEAQRRILEEKLQQAAAREKEREEKPKPLSLSVPPLMVAQGAQKTETKEEKPRLSVSYIINYHDLKIDKELGQGGYGVVYQATWRYVEVAIKQLLNKTPTPAAIEEFEAEAHIMTQLRSPNVVQFYGYCLSPSYCLVMEYMPKGSLYSVLHSKQPLDWKIRSTIITDMACGLAFLHAENILHRDIKSLNVLLDVNFRAKLTDFGLSKIKTETRTLSTKNNSSAGTLSWTAPELFTLRPTHTKQSDVYSLGITMWEVAARKLPYAEAPTSLIRDLVKEGEREEVPEDCPPKIASLIRFCWHKDVKKRPEAGRVVEYMKDEKADDFETFSAPGLRK
jgi:Ran GTPase-activating protein (RanGAP) involved in mRNA processing and transport